MNMRASLFPVRSVHDAINREGKPNKTKWLKILVRGSESEQTYEPKVGPTNLQAKIPQLGHATALNAKGNDPVLYRVFRLEKQKRGSLDFHTDKRTAILHADGSDLDEPANTGRRDATKPLALTARPFTSATKVLFEENK